MILKINEMDLKRKFKMKRKLNVKKSSFEWKLKNFFTKDHFDIFQSVDSFHLIQKE